jgi:tRNA pseudouridine38-40 synthase
MDFIIPNNWIYYKATVSYQGTNFQGWQSQKHQNTIQDCIESILYKIFKFKQKIIGASRTDSGVHAYGQVFCFHAPSIKIEQLNLIFNNSLPDFILIRNIIEIEKSFHPRFLAKKKVYQYLITNNKLLPHLNAFILTYKKIIDIKKLNECLNLFIGTHDFKSFSKYDYEKNSIRTIYEFNIDKKNEIYIISIVGNGFLRYMIRKLLGAAISYATKTIKLDYINDIFKSKNSNNTIIMLPAKGLMLKNILYKENEIINFSNPFL